MSLIPPGPTAFQHFAPAYPGAGVYAQPTDLGFAAWTQDPQTCNPNAGVAGTAGTLQLRRMSVGGVQVITNVFLAVTTAAVGATANQCFAGVWNQNGQLIGLTADMSGAIGSTGLKALPLVAGAGMPVGPFVVDTPYIYVGHWWNAGTSGPGLVRGTIDFDPNGASTVPAATARVVTANTGLTTIAGAPLQLGALTKDPNTCNWYAIA